MTFVIRTNISNTEIKEVSKRWSNEMMMRSIYQDIVMLHRFLEKYRFSPHLHPTELMMIVQRLQLFDQIHIAAFKRLFQHQEEILKTERMLSLFNRLKYLVHCVNMLTFVLQNKAKQLHVNFFSKDDWSVDYTYWRFKTFDWN